MAETTIPAMNDRLPRPISLPRELTVSRTVSTDQSTITTWAVGIRIVLMDEESACIISLKK